ncbi:hypothetical protein [Nonomuraea dietziae]|uniref:hypothetical protein n=1 Tax=Nonomuraea dietziae TaxID=65515 RepID=UPI0031DA2C51
MKETIAPLLNEPHPEVDRDSRMTRETWQSLDGKQTALDDGEGKLIIEEARPDITAADLAKSPVTPEESLARIEAVVDATPASPFDDGASRQQRVFQAISQLMREQALTPEVRAALFRALPMVEGVTVKQDAVDATGPPRRGVRLHRPVGALRDRPQLGRLPVPGNVPRGHRDRTLETITVKAGTPLSWTAHWRPSSSTSPATATDTSPPRRGKRGRGSPHDPLLSAPRPFLSADLRGLPGATSYERGRAGRCAGPRASRSGASMAGNVTAPVELRQCSIFPAGSMTERTVGRAAKNSAPVGGPAGSSPPSGVAPPRRAWAVICA